MTTPEDTLGGGDSTVDSIDFMAIIQELVDARKLIVYTTAATTIIAVVLALVLPEKFSSSATLIPGSQKSGGGGNLSQLAALAGVNIGGETGIMDAELYPTLITSESVLRSVIYTKYSSTQFADSVNLVDYYEIEEETEAKQFESALKTMRDELKVSMDRKTKLITVELLTKEPNFSAQVVNKVVREIDEFITTKRMSSAGFQRQFVEDRLVEVATDLRSAEENLKSFREKNRAISTSPDLLLRQERLLRDVTINNTLFVELKKQYEISKIEEVKDTPIITVVDSARAAAFKTEPKRRNLVLIGLFLGFFGSIATVLGFNRIPESLKAAFPRLLSRRA